MALAEDDPNVAEPPKRGRIRAANEERLLAAAEAVFAEVGFEGATTAAIARRAGLPKANLHYYFGTKEALYRAVLRDILAVWLGAADAIADDVDPAAALTAYIRAKIDWSRRRPAASKLFAGEMLRGAPELKDYLATDLKQVVDDKARVLERWMAEGRIARVDPRHLLFVIWASTQTYADFAVQIAAVLGKPALDDDDFDMAARLVVTLVLRGLDRVG